MTSSAQGYGTQIAGQPLAATLPLQASGANQNGLNALTPPQQLAPHLFSTGYNLPQPRAQTAPPMPMGPGAPPMNYMPAGYGPSPGMESPAAGPFMFPRGALARPPQPEAQNADATGASQGIGSLGNDEAQDFVQTTAQSLRQQIADPNDITRQGASADLLNQLQRNKSLGTNPATSRVIHELLGRMLHDSDPVVRQNALLAYDLGLIKKPPASVMTRMKELSKGPDSLEMLNTPGMAKSLLGKLNVGNFGPDAGAFNMMQKPSWMPGAQFGMQPQAPNFGQKLNVISSSTSVA